MNIKSFSLIALLLLSLAGCTASINDNSNFITETEAIKIAQKYVQDREATWHAEFKIDEVIQFNNVDEKHTVWIVEALFSSGNKEIYKIDAESGNLLMMTELEPPGS